jgi:hypothetical protein
MCDPTTYDLLSVRYLLGLLYGRPSTLDENKLKRSIYLLYLYLGYNRKDHPLNLRIHPGDEYLSYFSPDDPFQPYFANQPIGASALIEGQAVFVQEYELEMLDLQLHELKQFYTVPVSVYHLTQAVWLDFFQGVIKGDEIRVWEYLWVLNLALWIPIFPGNTGQRDWHWHDIHPGWRFLKICMALKLSRYRFLPDEASADAAASFEPVFMKAICKAWGWPTPSEIAEHWLNSWGHELVSGLYNERDEQGTLAHPRIRFMRSYFQNVRYGQSFDLNDANLRHFPLAAVICDDSSIMMPAGCWGMYDTLTGNRLFRLKEYIMYDFAKYWGLGEGLGSYILRNEMAEFSTLCLADFFSQRAGVTRECSTEIRRIITEEIQRIRG